MSDVPERPPVETPIVNRTIRAVIAICVLVFSGAMIVAIVLFGKADNSLHTSALAWSYWMVMFTLLALGLDSAAAALVATMMAKKDKS